MNSLDCDRISAKASARSFDAAITRPEISPSTFAPAFRPDQSAGGGNGTQAGQLHGLMMGLGGPVGFVGFVGLGGLVGLMACQVVPAKSFRASQEYHSADQLRSRKCGALMIGRSPIGVGTTGALGPVSNSVTRGRFTRSAKNHPLLTLVALPALPAFALLPSLPSLPSKLAGMVCLLCLLRQLHLSRS